MEMNDETTELLHRIVDEKNAMMISCKAAADKKTNQAVHDFTFQKRVVECPTRWQQRRNDFTRRRYSWLFTTMLVVSMVSCVLLDKVPASYAQVIDRDVDVNSEDFIRDSDDHCSKRYQRRIDQLQKEVGYCNAVKMAVETREGVVKQQLMDVQQQLQLKNSTSTTAEMEHLLQQVASQQKQIQELELRNINESAACMERNEYLEMRMEEALENEQRIDEMSQQLHAAKLYRIETKQALKVYEEQSALYEGRIEELERQNKQFADEVIGLSQAITDKDFVVSTLEKSVEVYKDRAEQQRLAMEKLAQCNDLLVQVQQQSDDIEVDYNRRMETLQQLLNDEMERSKQLNEEVENERNMRRHLEQVHEEMSIDCKDRFITAEQMWQEEVERTKQLTQSLLEMERDRQQQALSIAKPTIYHHYIAQLRQINQQYQNRHTVDDEKIVQLQNELYTLRYDMHMQNEMWRHRGAFEKFYILTILPILSWCYDPLWSRMLEPHLVVPACTVLSPYYNKFVWYAQLLFRHCQHYTIHAFATLRIWYEVTVVASVTAYQQSILPTMHIVRDLIVRYYTNVSYAIGRAQLSIQRSIIDAVDTALPHIAPVGVFVQHYMKAAWDSVSPHAAPIRLHVLSSFHTGGVMIDEWKKHFEQKIVSIAKSHGLDGTKFVGIFDIIGWLIGLVSLVYLMRRRRLRYVVPAVR